ncbi:unnamed protein product [Blepharisma stoltei]|uniref:Uncharacterized protein n=1 Tax=Blepharisma stoltei TaxID=1481888 RepID=A0AAU9J200_9CILI|nr:unnamed protein product [Blepharisma stoltei]
MRLHLIHKDQSHHAFTFSIKKFKEKRCQWILGNSQNYKIHHALHNFTSSSVQLIIFCWSTEKKFRCIEYPFKILRDISNPI